MSNGTQPGTSGSGNERWVVWEDVGQKQGYTVFPKVVQFNRNLSRHARFLYSLLIGYAWDDEECFPGQDTLMADMGCKHEQLKKYMIELRDAGLIAWKRRGQGKPNLYTIKSLAKLESPEELFPESPKKGIQEDPKEGHYEEALTKEADTKSTDSASSAKNGDSEARKADRSEAQQLMDEIYRALKDRKMRLTKDEYAFNLGRIGNMLKHDDPVEAELDELPKACVEYFEWYGTLDVVKALRRRRQQQLRRVREQESTQEKADKPAPWEQTNPNSDESIAAKDKPRKPEWYASCYIASPEFAQKMIDLGYSHSEIVDKLESANV